MPDEAVALLTTESRERILRQGGSQSWVLNRAVARKMPYVVCVRNAKRADPDGNEPHGSAFMVGRISDIVPVPQSERREGENGDRWKVVISEFAGIDIPDAWKGSRNPVRYTTLQGLGINPAELDFRPMPPLPTASARLTIQEAKEALARTFGVSPDCIEITIRA